MGAHALVPVGSDGLSYAFNNNPTNYVGDYLWQVDDLLGGGSSAPPEAQAFSRNFGSPLDTQRTLAATPGASTTNSDNAASAGSGGTGSSSGTTSYGTGSGLGGSAAENAAGAVFGPAGLLFVKTTAMIIATGDAAAIKSLTNQVVSAVAEFIVCDGNSCREATPVHIGSSADTGVYYHDDDPSYGRIGVQAATDVGYFSVPAAGEQPTDEEVQAALDEVIAILEVEELSKQRFLFATTPSCMVCHGTGVLDGRVKFEDLSESQQYSILRYASRPVHAPEPELPTGSVAGWPRHRFGCLGC